MTERSVFFACKPGLDPVQVPNRSAHTRLPWVAQGYEIFAWVIETRGAQHWVVQKIEERDALYRFHGLDFYGGNVALNWASMTKAQVERRLWIQIREEQEMVRREKELEQEAMLLAYLRAKTEQKPGTSDPITDQPAA